MKTPYSALIWGKEIREQAQVRAILRAVLGWLCLFALSAIMACAFAWAV